MRKRDTMRGNGSHRRRCDGSRSGEERSVTGGGSCRGRNSRAGRGRQNNSDFSCRGETALELTSTDNSLSKHDSSSAEEGEDVGTGPSATARESSDERRRSYGARVLYRTGLRLEARGRISAAIGLYRQALRLDPGLDERSMWVEDHSEGEDDDDDVFQKDACDEHEQLLAEMRENPAPPLEPAAAGRRLRKQREGRRVCEAPLHTLDGRTATEHSQEEYSSKSEGTTAPSEGRSEHTLCRSRLHGKNAEGEKRSDSSADALAHSTGDAGALQDGKLENGQEGAREKENYPRQRGLSPPTGNSFDSAGSAAGGHAAPAEGTVTTEASGDTVNTSAGCGHSCQKRRADGASPVQYSQKYGLGREMKEGHLGSSLHLQEEVDGETQLPGSRQRGSRRQGRSCGSADHAGQCSCKPCKPRQMRTKESASPCLEGPVDAVQASDGAAGVCAAPAAEKRKYSSADSHTAAERHAEAADALHDDVVSSPQSERRVLRPQSLHSCGDPASATPEDVSKPGTQYASCRVSARTFAPEAAPICGPAQAVQPEASLSWLQILPPDFFLSLALYLDAYSLTRLSMSCQVLRDLCGSGNNKCWRVKCLQVFGLRCVTDYHLYSDSWHRMYMHRPRIRMDGIYISRSMYLRRVRDVGRLYLDEHEQEGRRHRKHLQRKPNQEFSSTTVQWISNLMQSAHSPVLAVTYHRYLRFLPGAKGNRVLVLRTEAEKAVAVQALKAAERRLQENSSRSGTSHNVVISAAGTQNEESPGTSSVAADSSCSALGSSHHLSRSGWTWQWLLPHVALGEFSFDWQSRRLHVFYNEPRSGSAAQPCAPGTCARGPATRSANVRRQQDASDSKRNSLHDGVRATAVVAAEPDVFAEQNVLCMKSEDLPDIVKPSPSDKRTHPRPTHRAVFEVCSGPAGRSNSRLRWISFSISSVIGEQEDGEEGSTTNLNVNSEHFRPFAFSRVRSFESFF